MSAIKDRWLWLGFGIFFYASVKLIRYGLIQVYELNIFTPNELALQPLRPSTDDPNIATSSSSRPEDSIRGSALTVLIRSPNRAVASSATAILTSRFLTQPSQHDPWLRDLFSPDRKTRTAAAHLYAFLGGDHSLRQILPASSSIVQLASLIQISTNKHPGPAATVQAAYRLINKHGGAHARTCLANISRTMTMLGDTSIVLCPDMVEAQVGPWLDAQQNFQWMSSKPSSPNATAEALERMYAAGGSTLVAVDGAETEPAESEPRPASLAEWEACWNETHADGQGEHFTERGLTLRDTGPIQSELSARRLLGHRTAAEHAEDEAEREQLMRWGQVRSVAPTPVPRRRRGGQGEASYEEIEVRRRRREAMVLHEGQGSVQGQDIFTMPPRRDT